MTSTHFQAACEALNRNDWQVARQALGRGAQAGDPDCLLELGAWFLSGQVLARDLTKARECFKRAGERGHKQAAALYRNFLAIGVGGQRDWTASLSSLRQAATTDEAAAAQVELLDAMSIDEKGEPRGALLPKTMSLSPDVVSFEQLLSAGECEYLIRLAAPMVQPSVVVDPRSGAMRPDAVRTSDAAMIAWASEDLVVHAINRRIAAASATATEAGEPLQVLRYAPGQEYRPHFDALPDAANQRIVTMLVYLNDDYDGGDTCFPKSGVRFRGNTGDALMFRNALPDGRPDPASLHAGEPVRRGTKYLATRWIHQRTFMPLV